MTVKDKLVRFWKAHLRDYDQRHWLRAWWKEHPDNYSAGFNRLERSLGMDPEEGRQWDNELCDSIVTWGDRDEGDTVDTLLASCDSLEPPQPPDPELGQKWLFVNEGIGRMVGAVQEEVDHWLVWWSDSPRPSLSGIPVRYEKVGPGNVLLCVWPPADAVCIDQLGRPWAPEDVLAKAMATT